MRILALFFHPAVYGKIKMGGVERRFIEVSKVMRRMNISVYALEFYPSLKRFLDTGYISCEINRPFPMRFHERVLSMFQALRLGITIHRVRKFQLVLITGHRYVSFAVLCTYLLAKLLRVPWVIVSGGLLPRERMSLRSLMADRRRRGFAFLRALTRTAVDLFTRQLYRRAAAFITVSQSEKNDVIRYLGVSPAKIYVVGNGVDLELIDSIPKKEKLFDAAFLGRVDPGKGIDTLVRSWTRVVEQIPSAQLVVIGGGKVLYYRRLVESKNLSNNIRFVGFKPFEQAMALLKQSKVFLFPSERESFPLSLLEAMACSLPCVISDIPPLRENFNKGTILVKPDNFEGFAKATIDLIKHDQRRNNLGLQARRHAETFSWEKVVRREISVLEKVLKSHGSRGFFFSATQ